MVPWVYEFRWEPGHIVFLALFFFVIVTVLWTVAKAIRSAVRDFQSGREDEILWGSTFEDLSASSKRCRHELAGELMNRVCPNGFDCRRCEVHQQIVQQRRTVFPRRQVADSLSGLAVSSDLYYHRGHTCVRRETDGTLTVGLDDLGKRLVGNPDGIELPPIGTHLRVNGTGWSFTRGEARARILSPVDGEVLATGGNTEGWYLRIKADSPSDLSHLLRGDEVKAWLMHELERLQWVMGGNETGVALADGGTLVTDIPEALKEGYESVWEEMFLEP